MPPVEPHALPRLTRRLLGPMLVLVALFVAAVIFGSHHFMHRMLEQRAIQRGSLFAHAVANVAGTLSDPLEVARLISALAAERDVVSVIVTAGNRVIAANELRLIDMPAVHLPAHDWGVLRKLAGNRTEHCEFHELDSHVVCALRVALPIADTAQRHGFVRLVMDISVLEAQLAATIRSQLAWLTALLVPIIGLLLAMIRHLVIKPIVTLTRAAAAPDFDRALAATDSLKVRELDLLARTLSSTIAARRHSEAALLEHLERFNLAVDGAADVIWDVDLVRDASFFSLRLGELLGVEAARIPRTAAEFNALLHPDDLPMFKRAVTAHVRDRQPYAIECRLRHADGSYLWISSRGQAIWNAEGRATRIAGSLHDITARRHAEAAMAALNSRMGRIINHFGGIIFEYTRTDDGAEWFESHSPLLHEYFVLPDRGSSHPLAALMVQVHPEDRESLGNAVDTAIANGQPWLEEFRVLHGERGVRWLEGRSMPRREAGRLVFTGTLIDITARKQAEAEIENQRALLASVVENTTGVSFRCRVDGDWPLVYISDGIEKLTGHPPAYFVAPGAPSFLALMNPADLPECERRVSAALASKESWRIEYRLRHRNGAERWIASQGTVVFDLDGSPSHVDGILFDIDELKRAEIAVRESEQRLNLVVRGGDLGTWEWDCAQHVIRVNPRWQEIRGGAPRGEVSETEAWQAIHPADRARVRRAMTDHLERRAPLYEAEFRVRSTIHPDEWVWVLDRGQIMQRDAYGRALLWVGTHIDIDDRKRAAQKLQDSQTLLRTVIDMLTQRVFWKDRNGRYLGANRAFATESGYDNIVGLSLHDLDFSLQDIERFEQSDRRTFEQGETLSDVVVQMSPPDGKPRWVSLSKAPLRDTEGQIVGVVGSYLDVTEFKQTEFALIAARDAADAASRAKSEFLSTVSHEIRTPLNGVLGCSELLKGSDLTADQSHLVDMIRSCSQTLLSMLNDILDLSRIEARKLSIERVPFCPREVCADVVELLAPRAEEQGLELALLWQSTAPAVIEADPTRLRQVLTNLVGNAIKFTPDGSVVLAALAAPGGGIRFEVRDTGIGIAPTQHAAIFESFTQADSSITRTFGGTGLGLAISKKLVEAHGGAIGVVSAPGAGATFWVTLPGGTDMGGSVVAEAPAMLAGRSALVLSAHALRCEALVGDLTALGLTTVAVNSLAAAQALLRRQPGCVVLIDCIWADGSVDGALAMLRGACVGARFVALATLREAVGLDRRQFDATLTIPATRPGVIAEALCAALAAPAAGQHQDPAPGVLRVSG